MLYQSTFSDYKKIHDVYQFCDLKFPEFSRFSMITFSKFPEFLVQWNM